ncbi:uncharacterized protein LOC126736377 [Anthonomus grandis grandis]|uniref:uncharacterized protein LOC126736377 n=1 Tax=Anthonomus grandis grandis TaxID=2921223 RepID=UPI0021652504|nr:uncharacterized protein LOC126736377 [Anthonomus grandis grandis]
MQVLPLKVLEAQVCSHCYNYLTILPVTQTDDGKIFCGRKACRQNQATPSLLNTVLDFFQFPCVNQLDDCKELLEVKTSKVHEHICVFKPHECFFCSYDGNWVQILNHIKTEHPSKVSPVCQFSFEVGAESSDVFLYLTDDGGIYLISVNVSSAKLEVTIKTPTSCDVSIKPIRCSYSLNSYYDDNTLVEYNYFNSSSKSYFDKSIEELAFCFKLGALVTCHIAFGSLDLSLREVELTKKDLWLKELINTQANSVYNKQKSLDEFDASLKKQNANIERFLLILRQLVPRVFQCKQCDNPINTDVVFFCANGHGYCKDCVPNKCKASQCVGCTNFEKIEELANIYLNCEWDNCNKSISLPRFLEHKRECSQRPYVCPVTKCFVKLYSSVALLDHWHSNVKLETEYPLGFNYGVYNFFWLIRNDLYKVYVNFEETYGLVDIEAANIVAVKMLKFEIECENKNFQFYEKIRKNNYDKQVFHFKVIYSSTGYQISKSNTRVLLKISLNP